jgi:hypothetical protein
MNKLYLEPIGGLANRMRVIMSAIEFKTKYGGEIFCIWNENSDLNAPFYELFDEIKVLNFKDQPCIMNKLRSSNQTTILKRFLSNVNNKLFGFDYCIKKHDVQQLVESEQIYEIVEKNKGSIYIESFMIDYNWEDQNINEVFRLKNTMKDKVGENSKAFAIFDEVIGLHIRRTDNIEAIKNSPIELFIEKIEEKLEENKNTGFYLATDDQDIEFLLQKLYPGKILVYNKNLSRDSLEGIQDALVDMYTLSKTAMIYGSHFSSFSTMAGKIGGIECIRLKKNH